ncbi:MAG: shikimate dehydrogenase [Acidiferrobacterales bacterium]|nr:shikimate dehydrogenase [Acidiferrobacterales bacterium]
MTDLFDFKAPKKNFALMGNPVSHSKSPVIHKSFALQCSKEIEYDLIQVDIGGFDQAVSHFAAHGGAGLNVTVPFKVEAWQMCQRNGNKLSERAAMAESVNTLQFHHDGSVSGDNTDGIGLVRDIENNIRFQISDKSILLIGAGGASRGAIGPLLQSSPSKLHIVNRTPQKASQLAANFQSMGTITGGSLESDASAFDLIINATASSLSGQLPGILAENIHAESMIYDMMYATEPTPFMKWALDQGAAMAVDGLGMLVEQAAEAFRVWQSVLPDTSSVIASLRKQ